MSGSSVRQFWIHTPHPFLVQFGENFGIRYYGLAYLLAFVAAFFLLLRYHRAGRSPLNPAAVWDLMLFLVIGVMAGGRLGYFLLYRPADLVASPWTLFQVWQGGMASHGGFLGVTIALGWFCRSRRLSLLQVADVVVTTVPVGLGLGRLANFLNGELWGKQSVVAWAMVFHATGGGPVPRHPSQLYEAALEGVLLFAFVQLRFWKSACPRTQPGRLSGEFLVAYAVLRAIGEIFREPDADLVLGLSRGTFYSLFLVAGGLALVSLTPRARPTRP